MFFEERFCTSCRAPIKGRSDKKFCDDYCRNNFNNRQKALEATTVFIRAVNKTLGKNRRIIKDILCEKQKTMVLRDRLLVQGFVFNFHTHTHTTKSGNTYYYNYEYGYLPLENNRVLLVRGDGGVASAY